MPVVRFFIRSLAVCALLLAAVPRAAAQSLFVEGSAFYGIENRAHTSVSASTSPDLDLSGSAPGGGFAIGTWLTPSVSVRLELAFPATRTESRELTNVVIPVDLTRPPGSTPLPSVAIVNRLEASERLSTASALVAYHTARRHRIQLAYLGGAAFAIIEQRTRYSTTYLNDTGLLQQLVPAPRATELTGTSYGVTAQVGTDADIRLANHFSVVPQARMLAFAGALSVRVGVAARARW